MMATVTATEQRIWAAIERDVIGIGLEVNGIPLEENIPPRNLGALVEAVVSGYRRTLEDIADNPGFEARVRKKAQAALGLAAPLFEVRVDACSHDHDRLVTLTETFGAIGHGEEGREEERTHLRPRFATEMVARAFRDALPGSCKCGFDSRIDRVRE